MFWSAWSRILPTSRRPDDHQAGWPLIVRALYGPRKEETPFADGRRGALELYLLIDLGVRREMIRALSALEANDP